MMDLVALWRARGVSGQLCAVLDLDYDEQRADYVETIAWGERCPS
jgi:hypothetical protein